MCISQVSPVYSKSNSTLDAMIDHNIIVVTYSTIMVSTIVGLFPLYGASHTSSITN